MPQSPSKPDPKLKPFIHSTPRDAVKGRVRDLVLIDGTNFIIERPDSSDLLFDHPAVREAYASDEYIPYWTELWPASRMLAKAILREPWQNTRFREALEVGCGLGLAGIAALSRGLHVTFSDIDQLAVEFAEGNARLNGYSQFTSTAIDLRSPPQNQQYPILIGADLLYEPRMLEPVIHFIHTMLSPGGICMIADPDRISARPFRFTAEKSGLVVETSFARAGEPGGERTKGTIYRVTKPTKAKAL